MISESYRAEQAKLHENPNYGVASMSFAPLVSQLLNQTKIKDVLDYGAGKGNLAKSLKVEHDVSVHHYEPANPDWASPPDSHQMVCCIDVLEHIEPEYLEEVLDDLERVTEVVGFFSVHTGPAIKTLSDGRNAHLTQKPAEWWLIKFLERFKLVQFTLTESGFYVIVRPK